MIYHWYIADISDCRILILKIVLSEWYIADISVFCIDIWKSWYIKLFSKQMIYHWYIIFSSWYITLNRYFIVSISERYITDISLIWYLKNRAIIDISCKGHFLCWYLRDISGKVIDISIFIWYSDDISWYIGDISPLFFP